jgi:hypothetical protein
MLTGDWLFSFMTQISADCYGYLTAYFIRVYLRESASNLKGQSRVRMTGMAMCQKEPADGVTHLPVIQGGRETQNAIVLISVR